MQLVASRSKLEGGGLRVEQQTVDRSVGAAKARQDCQKKQPLNRDWQRQISGLTVTISDIPEHHQQIHPSRRCQPQLQAVVQTSTVCVYLHISVHTTTCRCCFHNEVASLAEARRVLLKVSTEHDDQAHPTLYTSIRNGFNMHREPHQHA
jgi:hypothetical protein